MIAGSDTK
jgi:hypothetical protein